MRRRTRTATGGLAWPAMALAAAVAAAPADAQARRSSDEETREEVVIRLLPPASSQLSGKTRIETLLTDPEVHNVVFRVDGEIAARRRSPPWAANLQLAAPPREQVIRAEALDADDRLLASDEMVVNREVRPLRVSLRAIEPSADGLDVRAEVSIPEQVDLESLEVFLGEERRHVYSHDELATGVLVNGRFGDGELEISLAAGELDPRAFVRLVARLADGRAIEDVALVAAPGFEEEIDVNLVQLQVVVTNKRGMPMRGLQKEHFRISVGDRDREPAGMFAADDVSLLLGLALDSSGSMQRIWPQTQRAATTFLADTLRERDEGFLVDFDTGLRLVQARTADRDLLREALDDLEPGGGTALYDSILFSLLQFDRQQGRRGLVVLTDGYDIDSQADPQRAIEFGKKLGVPIYILALASQGGARLPNRGLSSGIGDPGAALQTLKLLTDPTGGRLYRIGSQEQMARAFALINAELRNQYVLTYYTDKPPEPGRPPRVTIEAPGHKGLKAKVVFGADQIY